MVIFKFFSNQFFSKSTGPIKGYTGRGNFFPKKKVCAHVLLLSRVMREYIEGLKNVFFFIKNINSVRR